MMKRILIALLPALVLFGCQPEEKGPAVPLVDYTEFNASNETMGWNGAGGSTTGGSGATGNTTSGSGTAGSATGNSTSGTSATGKTISWAESDVVNAYFTLSASSDYEGYHVKKGFNNGASTVLEADRAVTRENAERVIAAYGAITADFEDDGATLTAHFDLPSDRTYRKGTVSRADMPRMAIAGSGIHNLGFKNLLGVAVVSVKGDGTSIKSISIEGNNYEILSGELVVTVSDGAYATAVRKTSSSERSITLDCSKAAALSGGEATDFYISMPAMEFTKGVSIAVTTADDVIHTTLESPVSITRNNITFLTTISLSQWADEFEKVCEKYSFAEQNVSTITPMGTHFETFKTATDAQKSWLADPTKQPNKLADGQDWTLTAKPVTLYPFGHPCPADVNQHNISNCCFLAVLGALSQSYPGFIEDIITANADGTYTVKMFDPMGNRVDVGMDATFFYTAKNAAAGVTGHNGVHTWASILEKALEKYETCFSCDPVAGINPTPALAPFVGVGTSHKFAIKNVPEDDMTHAVESCLRAGKIMTGGFRVNGYLVGTGKTVTLHEYSCFLTPTPITDYYNDGKHYLFTLRNPWGFVNGGTVRGDGCMDLYWDDELFPSNVYLRILDPGAAAPFFVGAEEYTAYKKPF